MYMCVYVNSQILVISLTISILSCNYRIQIDNGSCRQKM